MSKPSMKITNATVITPQGLQRRSGVVTRDGRIAAVGGDLLGIACDVEIDAGGKYLSPGFIDIHVHGGGGWDFMDNTTSAFREIAMMHSRHGTTSMLPTTLSSGYDDLVKTLETYDEYVADPHQVGASLLGVHIEGPYFAMEQRGAQDPRYIKIPDPKEYREILNRFPSVKRWSAAPELPGALELGKYLQSKGVLGAIAHTNAICEEVMEAFDSGYTHATHFYSCMSSVTRRNAFRYAGAVEAAYLLDDMTVELIADGVHLPPALLRLVCKIKGADKVCLITDAMRAAGLPPGESYLGSRHDGTKVIVEDGVAKLPDRSAFAGSVATCDLLVKNMITLADVSLANAVNMMTKNPATIMGIDRSKGTIEIGKDADLVIFDDNITVWHTIVEGQVVYTKNNGNGFSR